MINPSTPTFRNINLTEKTTYLIVAWKFNGKRWQDSLFSSTKLWKYLQIRFISDNSFLSCPSNSVNPHFWNSHLKITNGNLLLFSRIIEERLQKSLFAPLHLWWEIEIFFYLTLLSRHGPVNLSTPTFGNFNLAEKTTYLIVASKFNQKRQQEMIFIFIFAILRHWS